ncbi:uncharacterized protein taf1c isoform X2 [Archocentrus centrarchus]|nr:TATA box-binding protein-associated factor RNA polymerase I subunit C isoform X2 [Archocentrus centrarchus]
MDFIEHMKNFYTDHSMDAFGCMSEILGENFSFKQKGKKEKHLKNAVRLGKLKDLLDLLKLKICEPTYISQMLGQYSVQLWDVVHTIPPELLGSLLYEELAEHRDRLLFSEGATGGALTYVPFLQSGSGSQSGCLLYPNQGLHRLNFHKVELQHHRGGPSFVDASSSEPFSFQLKGAIRQISTTSLFSECCVGVRSDYHCGVWRFSERNEPRLLQVVSTPEVATCITVSPHVLGEVLVASESGAANLWTVGKGMQKVRAEDSNLYFNAKSSWRWCEFTAHPRVMLYADRTGAELSDIRVSPASCHTLFRISSSAECRSGERLILSRYLGDAHSFHHLITTQYSAYIMDERFPCVPMLKWDHMMQNPPVFCHIVPGSASSGSAAGGARTTKVLLSSQSSQEIMMLQYSGGRVEACVSRGPPQALLRPRDSLKHLPVQIPHRMDTATNRLSSPAAGLTCIQGEAGRGGGDKDCMCILQLTEAGDIFYQILEPEQLGADASRPQAAEDELKPQQQTLKENATRARKTADSRLVVSDTSSDEGIVGPTQGPSVPRTVAETPEKRWQTSSSDSSPELEKNRNPKRLQLQVIVNDDPLQEEGSGMDAGVKEKAVGAEETVGGASRRQTPVKLSRGVLITWKNWLQKLMHKSSEKKPRPHFRVQTQGLLCLPDNDEGDSSKGSMQSMRQEMKSCMSRRSLLLHSMVSASLRTPDVVPVPNQVNTDIWTDALSKRLTASWQGEEAWRKCWKDQLGPTKEAKIQALRRKRRREKEAKRAAGRRLDLSGSFTSSISYQSELCDFSDSAGWSSGLSQGAWSDTGSRGELSQPENISEDETLRAATPSVVQNDTPTTTPTATSQRVKRSDPHQTPSRTSTLPQTPSRTSTLPQTPSRTSTLPQTQTPGLDSTPARQRRSKRPADGDLSSLFTLQDDPSQSHFLDEGSSTSAFLTSSQLHSFQSIPLQNLRVDLSSVPVSSQRSSQSQSQSLSQSSRGRLSQASQPKKKSRMGF